MWYYYINEDNEIMFLHGSQGILGPYNEISIIFDYNEDNGLMSTLYKHGKEEDVLKHFWTVSLLNQLNPEMFNFIMYTFRKEQLLSSDQFILEELNKSISTTGYISKFIKKYIITHEK